MTEKNKQKWNEILKFAVTRTDSSPRGVGRFGRWTLEGAYERHQYDSGALQR